jgi:hypothetical protein
MVMVFCSVEDEHNFSSLALIKKKPLKSPYYSFGPCCMDVYLGILIIWNFTFYIFIHD